MKNVIDLDLLTKYSDLLGTRLALLKRNTSYVKDDVVQRDGKYFICTLAGTTDTNTLNISNVEIGDVIVDGTVTWKRIDVLKIIRHELDDHEITQGMNIKVTEKGKLVANDLIKDVRAAGNTEELNYLGIKSLSNKEIFDSWLPFSCDSNGTNWNVPSSSDQASARASYSFNVEEDAIICNRNNDAFSAFMSQEKYSPNFTVTYTIDNRILNSIDSSLPGDDDGLFFILGFMEDDNGNYHTLSVIRNGDATNDHGIRFAIAYDLFTSWTSGFGSTTKILSIDNTLNAHNWDGNSYATLEVSKTNTSITAKTTQINSTSYASTITYTLPTSKPSDMTQEQYDNIKYMLENDTKVGFGTQSNPSAFRLVSAQGSLNGISVYDISTLEKIYYEDGTQISQTVDKEVFLPQELIYSKLNRRLYYMKKKDEVQEIILNSLCEDWIPNGVYVENALVYYNGSAYRCKEFNTDSTFIQSKWESINGDSLAEWVSEKKYYIGNLVIYDNTKGIVSWTNNTTYNVDDKVINNSRIYKCIASNSDSYFNYNNWSYVDTARINLYRCIVENNDTVFTYANWQELNKNTLANEQTVLSMF